jgi:hypothetical protein
MLMQNDVTNRVNAESILTGLSEGQVRITASMRDRVIFPDTASIHKGQSDIS